MRLPRLSINMRMQTAHADISMHSCGEYIYKVTSTVILSSKALKLTLFNHRARNSTLGTTHSGAGGATRDSCSSLAAFNRKEEVKDETYLGIKIFRFYSAFHSAMAKNPSDHAEYGDVLHNSQVHSMLVGNHLQD